MRKLNLFLVTVIVCSLAFFVGIASAGKTAPYLVVTPGSPATNSAFTVSGCGYQPGHRVGLIVWHSYTGPYASPNPVADIDGCVSTVFNSWSAGSYTAYSYQANGQGDWVKELASLEFTVS